MSARALGPVWAAAGRTLDGEVVVTSHLGQRLPGAALNAVALAILVNYNEVNPAGRASRRAEV